MALFHVDGLKSPNLSTGSALTIEAHNAPGVLRADHKMVSTWSCWSSEKGQPKATEMRSSLPSEETWMPSIEIPQTREGWTYEIIKRLCDEHAAETDTHEFKEKLIESDKLTKCCCAFANSKGGFLIFGIRDNSHQIVGMKRDPEFGKHFGDKLKAAPTIYFEPPVFIKIPAARKVLIVVGIPPSRRRPHVNADREKAKFWKRTNRGCEHMTIEEIRQQFRDQDVLWGKLRLLFLELEDCKLVLDTLGGPNAANAMLTPLDVSAIAPLLAEVQALFGEDTKVATQLTALRHYARKIEAERTRTFTFLGQCSTGQRHSYYRSFQQEAASNIASAVDIVDQVIEFLVNEFGLTRTLTRGS